MATLLGKTDEASRASKLCLASYRTLVMYVWLRFCACLKPYLVKVASYNNMYYNRKVFKYKAEQRFDQIDT